YWPFRPSSLPGFSGLPSSTSMPWCVPPLLERAGHAGDVAGGVGAAALGLDLEVEGGAIGVFVVLEPDVGAALDLFGALLPHRLGIVAVVGHLDAVLSIGRDVAGDGQPGHRDATLDAHGRLQGDGFGMDGLG